jgi:plasmid stability protein
MDTTIRNIDEGVFRRLKARAAAEGKTVGEALTEAMKVYTAWALPFEKKGSLLDLKPFDFGKGTEHLSDEIDEIVYGA